MPFEWPLVELKCLIKSGKGISYGIVQPGHAVAEGVPIVRVSDVRNDRIDVSTPLKVAADIEQNYTRTRLQGGELLITIVGTVGETAIVPRSLAGWNVARAIAVLPVRDDVGAYWVKLALRSPAVDALIRSRLNTTVQATLNLKDLSLLPIPLPSQSTRRGIVSILSALDDKIDLNRRMNATLEAMARAIFKDWFVEFGPTRAKMEGRPSYLASDLWTLFPDRLDDKGKPEGWNLSSIKNCCDKVFNGGTPKRNNSEYWSNGVIPWLTSGEVRRPFLIKTDNYITSLGFRNSSAKLVKPDSTVMALYGATAGKVAFVASEMTTNQAVCALIPKPDFRYYNYLVLANSTQILAGMARGSAQQNLSKGLVEGFPVLMASEQVMYRFDLALSPFFDKIVANDVEACTLSELRDLLLPKLMSGGIRLREAEKVIKAAL